MEMEQETASAAPAPSAASQTGTAQVTSGLKHKEKAEYVGMTVGDLRNKIGTTWDISSDSDAWVGDSAVDDNYVIKPGDELEFVKRTGEKG